MIVMKKKERLLKQYSDWLRMRNYSESTYKAYMGTIRNYWKYCDARKDNDGFDKETAVQNYLAYRMNEEKRDFSTVNGDYSSLQWFYKYILNREWNVRKLMRPKKEKRLPRYINPEEVSRLLESVSCEKHRLMLLMYYATGMRLSELRLLKWEDVNFSEGLIRVKGKGKKERIVILQEGLDKKLEAYRKLLRPTQLLVFEGKTPGKAIAPKTVQWGIIRAREKAGLPKWVTAHVLRHSYATATLKNGTDIITLKELLGHKKLATTMRYVHLNIHHFKSSYNPLSDPCMSVHLKVRPHPDLNPATASGE